MERSLLSIASFALTILCWGLYGPILHWGQQGMSIDATHQARLRPFVCVGIAYFLIGVLVPWIWLWYRGEKGSWTISGIWWSLLAGALGAVGALGVIMAFTFGGRPIYVMPIIFGGAPVVNAFLTIYMGRRIKEIGPLFLSGLIMVILGAVTVFLFAPHPTATAASGAAGGGLSGFMGQLLALAVTVIGWGAYGPVLHKGQAAMENSRMRPFLCVGVAYFVIAVVAATLLLQITSEPGAFTFWGTIWSLAGGAVGAIGALGIILAFNFGGKPIYVMPLVFGGAPVVNTLFTALFAGLLGSIDAMFLAGLILVIAGSAIVLVFAPRDPHPLPAGEGS
jgi:hypothetical protein